jgi:hypothetical protein
MATDSGGIGPSIQVYCPICKRWVDEMDTMLTCISEDYKGRAMAVFQCYSCNQSVVGHRRRNPWS